MLYSVLISGMKIPVAYLIVGRAMQCVHCGLDV